LPAVLLARACSALLAILCSAPGPIRPADWARAMSLTNKVSAVDALGIVVVVVVRLGSRGGLGVSQKPRPIPMTASATKAPIAVLVERQARC